LESLIKLGVFNFFSFSTIVLFLTAELNLSAILIPIDFGEANLVTYAPEFFISEL
jgi:hypothetical protein